MMRTGPRIAAFVTALAVVFAVSVWVGRSLGPQSDIAAAEHPAGHHAGTAAQPPRGLQASMDGYPLKLVQSLPSPERNSPLRFRIVDDAGAPVLRFEKPHEKLLHLIVVRNDLIAYQHVHPSLDDRGTWRHSPTQEHGGDGHGH